MLAILIIVVCLISNGIFACAEIAFVTVRRSALIPMSKEGNSKASLLLKLKEHPERVLSVVQVGITFVGMFAAAFGGYGAESVIAPLLTKTYDIKISVATFLSVLIVVLPLTYFNVVFGELVPKILALRSPVFFSLMLVRVLQLLNVVLLPIIKILEGSTKFLVAMFSKLFRHPKISAEGEVVELSELGPRGRQYVMNIVNIEKKTLKEIILPWDKVSFLKKENSIEEVDELALASGHTRLPVLDGEDVVGIIHTKEFFAWKKGQTGGNWHSMIRPPKKFDSNLTLFIAFIEMQKEKIHQAIVYENKKKLGLVTIEDILEEVVGEIYDEDDSGTLTRLLRSI